MLTKHLLNIPSLHVPDSFDLLSDLPHATVSLASKQAFAWIFHGLQEFLGIETNKRGLKGGVTGIEVVAGTVFGVMGVAIGIGDRRRYGHSRSYGKPGGSAARTECLKRLGTVIRSIKNFLVALVGDTSLGYS